ncbi:arabinofuranan 3-O-arabinosyltransferase [Spinactinospora alkalitolerans]|uniref:Arabinofuranan 3-O-arabinosyltransferase n=1 Tax=Spinactinospora alkalitolerans TaxID=687207 RepID=A0A852U682_9ACTN|nr:alpha-(1->3)-arabinofuranosyltransferase [Spinactinospora alkalitolerans]NYE49584.1 arabinofuranan 3-O-arabinosyltransferase [Spinactinospora alkalitolerans]
MTPGSAGAGPDGALLHRLKLFAVCLLLCAVAFSLDPTKIVGDTKIDLTIDPFGFLERALHLWDGSYFGQLQNQAYGYFFPNGPFHALFIALDMPEWVVQRLWMAVLMCAAFLGTVRLAGAFGIGTSHTRIVAGVAYALAPRVLTLLSYNSAELQPTMLLPWVLLPLVHGAARGASPMRAAMLSGLAFLFCGGTNAASELAVLVVPLLYLLTRAKGPRRRRLLGWWLAAILLVSFWWLVPLLLMGRYVFSFMPFTEDAATTTSVTSLVNALRGTSNWMGYVPAQGEVALPAGSELANTPWLILVTALVAGLGLVGLVDRRLPERLFLIVSVLTGTAIVVAGHTGDLTGPLAPFMQAMFDGALSPFRNIHKFDALIRLPLVLGLAHLPTAVAGRAAGRIGPLRVPAVPRGTARRAAAGACAVAVLATLTPLATVGGATRGGFARIPDHWYEVTDWIDAQGGGGMTMAVPGSARGEYLWGRPMDEPMQPLLESSWTNHQIIPWGSAGVSRLTQEIDQRISSGRGSEGLADTLARMGVRYLIVRNDLERSGNNGGWPARVHQALGDSPGIDHVRAFGPVVGSLDPLPAARWYDQPYRAVDVYAVRDAAPPVGTVPKDGALRVTGGPEALLALAEQGLLNDDRPVLLGDDPGAERIGPDDTVVTDTARRREVVYSDVRRNVTNTLTADEERRDAPAPDVMDPAWRPYTSVAAYDGIASVTASSSEAGASAGAGTRDPGRMPYAALDDAENTSWRSSGFKGANGEWLEIEFTEPRDVSGLTAAFEQIPGEPPPSEVTVATDTGSTSVAVDGSAEPQELTAPPGRTSTLRIRVDELAWEPEYRFGTRVGITSITVPGLEPGRTVEVPGVPGGAGTTVLTGSVGTAPGCMEGSKVWVCNRDLAVQGEGAHTVDRSFTLSEGAAGGEQVVSGQVVAADPGAVANAANRAGGHLEVTASSTSVRHPAAMGRNAFDDDPATVWYPDPGEATPSLDVELGERVRLNGIQVDFPRADSVTRPVKVTVETGSTVREGWLDGSGRLAFDPVRTDELTVTFDPPEGQPLEVRRIALPDVEPLERVGDEPVRSACGLGPALRVNGSRVDTRIVGGTLEDQFAGRPLEYESCTDLTLSEGRNRVVVEAGNQYRVRSAVVRDADVGERAPVTMAGVQAMAEWGPGERRFTVSGQNAEEDSYLVVNENFNEGWEATVEGRDAPLTPVRLDGWKQAWELPAGTAGTVTLRYTPDAAYHAALVVGGVLALAVAVLALARPRRGRASPASLALPSAVPARLRTPLLVPLALLFGLWVAGAAGVAVIGAALSAAWWAARRPADTKRHARERRPDAVTAVLRRAAGPWTALFSLGLAGLSLAAGTYLGIHLPFHDISGLLSEPLRGWVPQVLCLPALARVVVSLGRFDRPGRRSPRAPARRGARALPESVPEEVRA